MVRCCIAFGNAGDHGKAVCNSAQSREGCSSLTCRATVSDQPSSGSPAGPQVSLWNKEGDVLY